MTLMVEIPTSKIPLDVVGKKRWKIIILPESSQSLDQVIKQRELVEVRSTKKKKEKSLEYIPNPFI